MVLEQVIDIVLALLLGLTIFWCVAVHQKLRAVRDGQGEMAEFVEALTAATERAEQVVTEMKALGGEAEQRLVERRTELKSARSELSRLIDTAGRTSRRLESEIEKGVRLLAQARTSVDMIHNEDMHRADPADPARRGLFDHEPRPRSDATLRSTPQDEQHEARRTAEALLRALEVPD